MAGNELRVEAAKRLISVFETNPDFDKIKKVLEHMISTSMPLKFEEFNELLKPTNVTDEFSSALWNGLLLEFAALKLKD